MRRAAIAPAHSASRDGLFLSSRTALVATTMNRYSRVVKEARLKPDTRGPPEGGHYVPLKNDGRRMSRIVRSPGGAVSTAGIELTVIEAVAMSPCTPPAILE